MPEKNVTIRDHTDACIPHVWIDCNDSPKDTAYNQQGNLLQGPGRAPGPFVIWEIEITP